MSHAATALRGAAFAVGLQAKGGAVELKEVDALWLMANRVLNQGDAPLLDQNDALFIEIKKFVTHFPTIRFSKELPAFGTDLVEAVMRSFPKIEPEAPARREDAWQNRKDING